MTPEQLRRSIDNVVGPETRLPFFRDVCSWVLQELRAFGDRRSGWSFDFNKSAFNTEAEYTTGTVAITQSSTSVTGTGTTWTGITNARHKLRIGGVAYPITTIGGNTSITLTEAFAGSTVTASTYGISKDEFLLPALRSVRGVWDAGQNRRLTCIPLSRLGDLDSQYDSGGEPVAYSIFGRGTNNVPIIQIFPYPTAITRIEYWYQADYTRVADFGTDFGVPSTFDDVLRGGALARTMQLMRKNEWREEMGMFRQSLQDAWFLDQPAQETKVRLMRTDGIDNSKWNSISFQEVSV